MLAQKMCNTVLNLDQSIKLFAKFCANWRKRRSKDESEIFRIFKALIIHQFDVAFRYCLAWNKSDDRNICIWPFDVIFCNFGANLTSVASHSCFLIQIALSNDKSSCVNFTFGELKFGLLEFNRWLIVFSIV